MAFQLISMGKIALRYEQIGIRARSRNELNSYLEHKKSATERTIFHNFLPHLFATMTSHVAADFICYPFETVMHRLYIQGTRTLIDNLDSGMSAISITAKYTGFFDCLRSIIRREGFLAFFAGVGALAFQYGMHFCLLRFIRSAIDYGSFAFTSGNTSPKSNPLGSPIVLNSINEAKSNELNLKTDGFPQYTTTTTMPPKFSPYPTFGQSLSSAFHSHSPPYTGSPQRLNTPSDIPASQLFSTNMENFSRDPFGKLG